MMIDGEYDVKFNFLFDITITTSILKNQDIHSERMNAVMPDEYLGLYRLTSNRCTSHRDRLNRSIGAWFHDV